MSLPGRQCGLDRRTTEFEGSQLLHRDDNIAGQHQGGPDWFGDADSLRSSAVGAIIDAQQDSTQWPEHNHSQLLLKIIFK